VRSHPRGGSSTEQNACSPLAPEQADIDSVRARDCVSDREIGS
jgi:hypothetical protein